MLKCCHLLLGIYLKEYFKLKLEIVKTLEHWNYLLQKNRVLCHFFILANEIKSN